MSKKNQEEKHLNAKQRAYEEKQAKQGDRIVKWIIGVLILLAFFYIIWAFFMMGI
ncbi:hypothetical protein L6475_14155 [Prevotella sp. E9-3]|uniref:hypothetical protein n=1 Tax=Prevotella sp. E9-3 TaxID=2913621 RepID=UPI001EDB9981|nr:hypothetical protein [Prevotella sp. E9-3]UKK48320.1 hypothetical protein L6475_14155 [Prevotella sp. E9-3]